METLCLEFFENPTPNATILILDVDNFKTINDTFGHQQGDLVLKSFGKILKENTSEHDFVGRIGGDEFMILLTQVASRDQVEQLADRIIEGVHRIMATELKYHFSCSIGIAMLDPEWGLTYDRLFSNADRALYQTKKSGKDNKTFFTKQLLEDDKFKSVLIVDPMRVSRSLLASCLEGRFRVYEVNNGQEAIELINGRKTKVDTIILNVEMYDHDMQELLNQMKKHDVERKKVCFLVKNKNQEVNLDIKGLNVEYIFKPFDPSEVLKRVEKEVLGERFGF
jgi:diguanylate cyclase (GGDEF)-like protein